MQSFDCYGLQTHKGSAIKTRRLYKPSFCFILVADCITLADGIDVKTGELNLL